jgi:hypothetical protein
MQSTHRMNEMERRMLGEVYRRLVIERARAIATGNEDMARFLTEEIIQLEMQLSGGAPGLSGLLGK